jgi:cyclopropane-fatty-acyl-phospholipid synthase
MSTGALRAELESALPERPFEVEFWDGGTLPSTDAGDGPTFRVNGPAAIGHLLRAPGQLGLGRAYVSGMLEVDDLDAGLELLDRWSPPPFDRATRLRLMRAAVRAHGLRLPPRRPAAELIPSGRRHSAARDARAVRHHYDVGNDFCQLFLDESMTYSCAFFSRGGATLEEAQHAKLELVCTKLGLREGETLLDVGCGWGSFAAHAAEHHGVNVVGITLSREQAEYARRRVHRLGLSAQVEIRVMDYREVPAAFAGRFDAVASIGMVEHVGEARIDEYAHALASALEPGGRLLNHGIARLRHGDPEAGPFSERYVWPDAAPLHVSRVLLGLERAGFVTELVEGFGADYAVTLGHWLENLEARLPEALRLAGPERMRVWRLYLRAARRTFDTGFLGVYQVTSRLPGSASTLEPPPEPGLADVPRKVSRFRRDADAQPLVR